MVCPPHTDGKVQESRQAQFEASAGSTSANILLAKASHKGRVQSQGTGMYNLPPAREAIKFVDKRHRYKDGNRTMVTSDKSFPSSRCHPQCEMQSSRSTQNDFRWHMKLSEFLDMVLNNIKHIN